MSGERSRCSMPECDRPSYRRGLCSRHTRLARANGTFDAIPLRRKYSQPKPFGQGYVRLVDIPLPPIDAWAQRSDFAGDTDSR
jgi:hypothetical protein